ncbi:hypothetical protein M1M_02532 [Brucella abortus bv. 1 str. NI259]|nr:hypothetical protein M1M_02532 [Brucella abortus bv. 1 str. NI259]
MQRYRFDDKRILTEAIVELLNQGIEPEDLDLVLSRIGPVDLDLMQECLIEECGTTIIPNWRPHRWLPDGIKGRRLQRIRPRFSCLNPFGRAPRVAQQRL